MAIIYTHPRARVLLLVILVILVILLVPLATCQPPTKGAKSTWDDRGDHDVIIRGGTIYDGSGGPPVVGDVAISGDRIAAIVPATRGPMARRGTVEIDATGLAVAPGFINMLSWAAESLLVDGRGMSDIRQGVTLEVFGEGRSMGPLNQALRRQLVERQRVLRYEVEWTSLSGFLEHLEARGVSPNVASFVGASTVRSHVLGFDDKQPNAAELERMRHLVRDAMREGALGVGASLIYAPGVFAETAELVALARVAAQHDGMYIAHLRSETGQLLDAVDEHIEIADRAGVRAEIYHLKAAGQANWPLLDQAIARIEGARARGLSITTNMYTYTAAMTDLDAAMPPWVQEGGLERWIERLGDPAVRARVAHEMKTPSDEWENLYLAAGSADRLLLVAFKNPALRPLIGKSLAEVAAARGKSPEDTAMDLVVEDRSPVGTVYFLMSEDNVEREIALPYMSFGSDAPAYATEGDFLSLGTHPRAYGNVARLLGHYVRERRIITLSEAIRRLTSLPAENLRIRERGRLAPGYHADLAIFAPDEIQDHATFDAPHQYATGMKHVLVNGVFVLRDGAHTGATPGRVVRGPGWRGWHDSDAPRGAHRASGGSPCPPMAATPCTSTPSSPTK